MGRFFSDHEWTKALYLAEFDHGRYAREFLSGVDQHWQTAIALELVPQGTERNKESKLHTAIREGAKKVSLWVFVWCRC